MFIRCLQLRGSCGGEGTLSHLNQTELPLKHREAPQPHSSTRSDPHSVLKVQAQPQTPTGHLTMGTCLLPQAGSTCVCALPCRAQSLSGPVLGRLACPAHTFLPPSPPSTPSDPAEDKLCSLSGFSLDYKIYTCCEVPPTSFPCPQT